MNGNSTRRCPLEEVDSTGMRIMFGGLNVPLDDDTGRILRPIVLDCGDENRMYNDPGEKGDCEINFKPGDIIAGRGCRPSSGDEVFKEGVTDHFKEEIKEKLRRVFRRRL